MSRAQILVDQVKAQAPAMDLRNFVRLCYPTRSRKLFLNCLFVGDFTSCPPRFFILSSQPPSPVPTQVQISP
ncbi:MAG: hypothetical protein BZ151_11060 [Desulfobacca sp. 4484_104]|nr:MAG: hypothetical protein BZ151_11060 [Desulfobacca sp. 4484_104]